MLWCPAGIMAPASRPRPRHPRQARALERGAGGAAMCAFIAFWTGCPRRPWTSTATVWVEDEAHVVLGILAIGWRRPGASVARNLRGSSSSSNWGPLAEGQTRSPALRLLVGEVAGNWSALSAGVLRSLEAASARLKQGRAARRSPRGAGVATDERPSGRSCGEGGMMQVTRCWAAVLSDAALGEEHGSRVNRLVSGLG